MMARKTWIVAAAALGAWLTDLGGPRVGPLEVVPAVEAVVGMPLTPLSGAGVARRTVRRTTAVVATSAVVTSAAVAAATPPPTTVVVAAPAPVTAVAALPAGCAPAGAVFLCGTVHYKPYYQGTTVVYVVVPGP